LFNKGKRGGPKSLNPFKKRKEKSKVSVKEGKAQEPSQWTSLHHALHLNKKGKESPGRMKMLGDKKKSGVSNPSGLRSRSEGISINQNEEDGPHFQHVVSGGRQLSWLVTDTKTPRLQDKLYKVWEI
tara:strand:+ start:396 stop:776 length:381 start_codon:yes stop_codon:yes gene_type:complete